ncbi:hypothetical protein [Chryseolinea lacunae]|uniref:Calx-beta domain-containing protein n=1 Tax=Chryseolinea lacunae TaxID=2801331 RepID=A0ABS1KSC6_9BACT|nr:hypothetical protein [Chryseolinea lacunae]MBL0742250.1 hypothetical protein [Chryseolinea lacunae]
MRNGNVMMLASLLMAALVLVSCDENDATKPAGFDASSSTGDESGGTQTATLSLGKAAASDVVLTFNVKGTAALGGDYTLLTPSPITIKAGASTASIEFKLIDDSIIESADKKITFSIATITGYTVDASADRNSYTYTITDNDEIPASGMQVDLTWDLGEGVDIDTADLDLYLVYNVVVNGNEVTSMDVNEDTYSANESGFESFVIDPGLKDTEYYVVAVYRSGDVAVPFTLGFSHNTTGSNNSAGSFTASEVGTALFYGPIQKSGDTFSRTKAPTYTKYKLSSNVLSAL